MKTIGQHLSNIRALIKAYSRTPEGYTDESLYSLFVVSRAEVLKQKLEKLSFISEQNWMQVCLQLESSKWHNCDCVPDNLECKILKTVYLIPAVLTGMNNSKLKISTISGKQINLISEDSWFRKKDRNPTDYYGSIVNGYLVLWNVPASLKVILVSGIWSDVTQLSTIPNCSVDGEPMGVCFDTMTTLFPLEDEYARVAYELTLKLLNVPMQIPQDQTNDSNEFSKM